MLNKLKMSAIVITFSLAIMPSSGAAQIMAETNLYAIDASNNLISETDIKDVARIVAQGTNDHLADYSPRKSYDTDLVRDVENTLPQFPLPSDIVMRSDINTDTKDNPFSKTGTRFEGRYIPPLESGVSVKIEKKF